MSFNVSRANTVRLNICLAPWSVGLPIGSAFELQIRGPSSLAVDNELRGSVGLRYGLHLRTSNTRSWYQTRDIRSRSWRPTCYIEPENGFCLHTFPITVI